MSVVHPLRLRGRILARLFAHLPFLGRASDLDAADGRRPADFGIAGSVLHTRGHTPGAISVLLDSGDAIIGDVIMGGYAGGAIRPTKPNFHYFADDLAAAMASVDRVLAVTSGRLFVGHGGPLSHEAVVRWRASHGSAS